MDEQKDKFLVLISELDLVKMFGNYALGKITSQPSEKGEIFSNMYIVSFYVRYLQILIK